MNKQEQQEEFERGFSDRVQGLPSRFHPQENAAYYDGWETADAEAGNCTLMCDTESEDPEDHQERCGLRFKTIDVNRLYMTPAAYEAHEASLKRAREYDPDYDDSYLERMDDDLNADINRMMEARGRAQGEEIMAREAEMGRIHHNDILRMKQSAKQNDPTNILDEPFTRERFTITTHGDGAIVTAYGVAMIPEIEFETPESGVFDVCAAMEVATDWDGGFIDLMQSDSTFTTTEMMKRSTVRFVAFYEPKKVTFNYRVQSQPGSKQRWTLRGHPKVGIVGSILLEAREVSE